MGSKRTTRERRGRVEAIKIEQRRSQRRRTLLWAGAALTVGRAPSDPRRDLRMRDAFQDEPS